MAQDRFKAATRRGMWILAACGAAWGLAACGGSDPANDAVQRAALTINTLSLGGANPTPDVELRVAAYQKIVSELQPHTSAPTPETASAANMLVARAHTALGSVEADAVADAERQARDLLRSVRVQFDRYVAEQAQAASADAYDPAPHLADLDQQIHEKDAEIAAAWANKSALDKVLADLEEKAAAESSLAAQERQLETGLRQRAINASAVEQADLIGRANEHKRAADARDKEASLLRAQAAQRAPEGVGLQAEIDRLTDQRQLLDEAKAEIRAFAKASDDRAAASRAAAMEAAEKIRLLAGELAKLRAEIPETAEKAIDAFDRGAQAASAAGRAGGAAATLAEAGAKHAKADLLSRRVRGLRTYGAMLESLAGAKPPLPDSAGYAAQAQAAKAEADKLAAEAKELFAEVQDTYANAGGSGDVADRLQRLAASMESLSGVASGDADAGAMPEAEEPATADVQGSDVESEVRTVLLEFATAMRAMDFGRMAEFMHVESADGREVIAAITELESLCQERFQMSLKDVFVEAMTGMGMSDPFAETASLGLSGTPEEMVDELDLTVVSPTSVLAAPRDGGTEDESFELVKVNGEWKVKPPDLSGQFPLSAQQAKQLLQRVIADIRSGAIGTSQQVGPAIMQYMMEQMTPQQQGGG